MAKENILPFTKCIYRTYIQLNINGSTINVPTDKWNKIKENKIIADAVMEQEITDVQAEEIMES